MKVFGRFWNVLDFGFDLENNLGWQAPLLRAQSLPGRAAEGFAVLRVVPQGQPKPKQGRAEAGDVLF